jgi:hypothetical protein
VSNEWQRQIDRVQTASGVHIGMAIGDLQVMSLRPFSRAYMGCIGDSINMAARLMNAAGPGEVVVSNMLYQRLDGERQAPFTPMDAIDAKNVGASRPGACTSPAPHVADAGPRAAHGPHARTAPITSAAWFHNPKHSAARSGDARPSSAHPARLVRTILFATAPLSFTLRAASGWP